MRAEASSDEATLIAPCGMNCRLCIAHTRERNPCPGCRIERGAKPKTRSECQIKLCARRRGSFCGDCDAFPCQRLTQLDRRYRAKYGMSMIENLRFIRMRGVENFVRHERTKWACRGCGETLCVHRSYCLACGRPRPVVNVL